MLRRPLVLLLAAAATLIPGCEGGGQGSVLVFEATGGGFAAAVAAARAGAAVTLLAAAGSGGGSGSHIGGMVTGGLQHTDCGNASVIGGIALEFFTRVELSYPNRSASPGLQPVTGPPCWLFESHVAEAVMRAMLAEANVTLIMGAQGVASVAMGTDGRIASLTTLSGGVYVADVFVDGSYEGDLLAAAGASMTVGRESAEQYGEAGGGRRPIIPYDGFSVQLDPYWPGTKEPLPLVYGGFPGNVGDGDEKVEAYTYRLCMTRSPGNSVPIVAPPPGYNASTYTLFRRLFAAAPPRALSSVLACLGPIPNNYTDCPKDSLTTPWRWCKCDMIGAGALNSDMAQGAWDYPNASVAARRGIALAHAHYVGGLIWFLSQDAAVPPVVAEEMRGYGLCADEHADAVPPFFPHQLYVREARRLVGDFVLTQNAPAAAQLNRSIGLGSYAFDAHTVQRPIHTDAGSGRAWVVNEGEIVTQPPCYQPPYRIPYETLLPARAQVTNALAAVPVSASHVVFTSLRMEPTWMIMGHAAGAAAAAAAAAGGAVQDVDVNALQAALVAAGQLITP